LAKRGRKPIEIDWKLFDGFCQMQCTLWEIACYFNCSEDTIERRVKEKTGVNFAEYFGKKRIAGLMSLRRNMFRMSEKNPAMAIFMAKNWLGMADKQEIEHSGSAEKPIGVKHVNFDSNKVAASIIEAIRLGLNPELLGGNGHGEDASLLSSPANIQTTSVPEP